MIHMKLFVAGKKPQDINIETEIRSVLNEKLGNKYTIEVIDVIESPYKAEKDKVLATPTLIGSFSGSEKRILGDIVKENQVFKNLLSNISERELLVKFRLYLVKKSKKGVMAIDNLTSLLDSEYPQQYELEIVDVFESPKKTETDRIMATPTLIRVKPEPQKRLMGDLSDRKIVKLLMDL